MRVPLWKIAHARSGDKADRADIGLFAWDAPTYEVLKREVTPERVAAHFRDLCQGPVELWPLDNLGKVVAAQLLRMEIEAPADLPRLRAP